MKNIIWKGTSLEDLKTYPKEVREATGFQLERLQSGSAPSHWQPVPPAGKNVKEMQIVTDGHDYRIYYMDDLDPTMIAKSTGVSVIPSIKNSICILHVSQYQSESQREQDIAIVHDRFTTLLSA